MENLPVSQIITSVSEYIEAILDLRISKEKEGENSSSSYWFFRGQKNETWPILPNIFRNNALQSEAALIDTAMRQRPHDFRECASDFEVLTKLQHYGLGTRLLDVTLNPLVALYFAAQDSYDFDCDADGIGKNIYRDGKIVYQYTYGHNLTDREIRIGCAIPFIHFTGDLTVAEFCKKLQRRKLLNSDEVSFLTEDNYKNLIRILHSNNFVVSSYSNDRITRQSGAFVIPTSIEIIGDDLDKGKCRIQKSPCDLDSEFEKSYFTVPEAAKENIRTELDFLNINEATLFPELEHQLNYLQNKQLGNPFKIEISETFSEMLNGSVSTTYVAPSYMEEPKPNIAQIVKENLSEHLDVSQQVEEILEKGISEIDWWLKDTAVSRMRRDITRILQKKMSAVMSRTLANSIVNQLLHAN